MGWSGAQAYKKYINIEHHIEQEKQESQKDEEAPGKIGPLPTHKQVSVACEHGQQCYEHVSHPRCMKQY